MNDKLNAIILDGEMYVLTQTLGNCSDCAVCDLRDHCNRDDGSFACSVFGVERGFSFHRAERMVRGEQTIDRHTRQVVIYR